MNAVDTPLSHAPLTGQPAWLALQKHAGTMAKAHLRELFSAREGQAAGLIDAANYCAQNPATLHLPSVFSQTLSPRLAGARSYKSADKPSDQAMETWESAVRALPVSEEEKKRLLSLQD